MISIRGAIAEDAPTVQALAEAIWWPTYGPILTAEQVRYMLDFIFDINKVAAQINTGEQTYLLLHDNEEAIGFASYSARIEGPRVYKLNKLYCLPEKQGRGYGKLLLQAVEKEVLAKNISTIELNVNRYNKAIDFYKKMGYEVIGEEDIAIGPYWMNDYVMRKDLVPSHI